MSSSVFTNLSCSIVAEITDTTNIAQVSINHKYSYPDIHIYIGVCIYANRMVHWRDGEFSVSRGINIFMNYSITQLGPIIGGSLSRPVEQFPSVFGTNEFLKRYPYFLPCAVPATFSAIAWIVTFLFLEETVMQPIPLSHLLNFRKSLVQESTVGSGTPRLPDIKKPMSLRTLLTRRVALAAGNYACLSLVDITFRAIQPLFFSTPIDLGGLGLPPSTIGKILAIFGVLDGVVHIFFFTKIHDYWGSKKVVVFGIASAVPAFISFPILSYMAKTRGITTGLWAIVAFQISISVGWSLSYGRQFLFMTLTIHVSSLTRL